MTRNEEIQYFIIKINLSISLFYHKNKFVNLFIQASLVCKWNIMKKMFLQHLTNTTFTTLLISEVAVLV